MNIHQDNEKQTDYQEEAHPNSFVNPRTRNLAHTINLFKPISLLDMDNVSLQNRIDTKYILSNMQLFTALHNLRYSYQVLEINHDRIHQYQTIYFDTRSFDLFHDHVTGRAEIFKVRSREYLNTQLSFLEVKHKNQKHRTEKNRIRIPRQSQKLCADCDNFLQVYNPFSSRELEPKLWNYFKRITLVSRRNLERLTIDIDLNFFNESDELFLDGIVVAEVKQDQFSSGSAFMGEMRRQGVRPIGFSKYCYGISQLYADVKSNSQKKKMLKIEKLRQGVFLYA